MIVRCANCNLDARPGDEVCPRCGTSNHLMVGLEMPGGAQVLAHRDTARFRVQGRRKDDGKMQYVASIGSPKIPDSSVRLKRKPVLKLYSDVLWNHDRATHRASRDVRGRRERLLQADLVQPRDRRDHVAEGGQAVRPGQAR